MILSGAEGTVRIMLNDPGYCLPFIDDDGKVKYMKFTLQGIGLVDVLGAGDKIGFDEPMDLRLLSARQRKAPRRHRKTVA